MNKLKTTIVIILTAIFTLAACSGPAVEKESEKHISGTKEQVRQHDSLSVHQHNDESGEVAFQCPMKCESEKTYAEAGTCPVCHMKLAEVSVASNEKAPKE